MVPVERAVRQRLMGVCSELLDRRQANAAQSLGLD